MNNIAAKLAVADLGGNLLKPSQSADAAADKSRWFSSMLTALLDEESSGNVSITSTHTGQDDDENELLVTYKQESADEATHEVSNFLSNTAFQVAEEDFTNQRNSVATPGDETVNSDATLDADPDKMLTLSDSQLNGGLISSEETSDAEQVAAAQKSVNHTSATPNLVDANSTNTQKDFVAQAAEQGQATAAGANHTDATSQDAMGSEASERSAGLAQANASETTTDGNQRVNVSPSAENSVISDKSTSIGENAASVGGATTNNSVTPGLGTPVIENLNSVEHKTKAATTSTPLTEAIKPDTANAAVPADDRGELNTSAKPDSAATVNPTSAAVNTASAVVNSPNSSERVAQVQQHSSSADFVDEDVPEAELQAALKSSIPRSERHVQPGTDRAAVENIRQDATASAVTGNTSTGGGGLSFGQNMFGAQVPEMLINPAELEAKDIASWKEAVNTTGLEVLRSTESSVDGFSRLSQIAIPNVALRREVLPALQQIVKQVADAAKSAPETWQKHNFMMDDGQRVDVMVRQVEGVMHLKLSSSNPELSRLLEEYAREIEEHLKETLAIEIDLQFGKGAEEGSSLAGAFGDSKGKSPYQNGLNDLLKAREINIKPQQTHSVRYFGYNRNEWTA